MHSLLVGALFLVPFGVAPLMAAWLWQWRRTRLIDRLADLKALDHLGIWSAKDPRAWR